AQLEAVFLEEVPAESIDPMVGGAVSDAEHPWGAGAAHYEQAVYERFRTQLRRIAGVQVTATWEPSPPSAPGASPPPERPPARPLARNPASTWWAMTGASSSVSPVSCTWYWSSPRCTRMVRSSPASPPALTSAVTRSAPSTSTRATCRTGPSR